MLRRITPEEEYTAGLQIYRQGGVHPLDDEGGMLRYVVDGDPRRVVRVGTLSKLSGRCSCDFFGNVHKPCRHLAAAMMLALSSGSIEEMRRRRARENAGKLMGTLQAVLPEETPILLEVTLRLVGETGVRVSLRVGQERLYVVKSMAQFLDALAKKEPMAFGKGFMLEPEWMGFAGVDAKIIRLLQDAAYVCQLEGKLVQTGLEAKYLPLPDRFVTRLLQLLMAKPFKISFGEEIFSVPCVFEGQAELLFGVMASGREMEIRAQMPKTLRALSADGRFVFCEGDVLRLPFAQREIVRVMLETAHEGQAAFRFDASQGTRVISELLPALERAGAVTIDGALAERIVRRELKVRAYFDREERMVVCKMVFLYGDEEIDPFAPVKAKAIGDENVIMLRDSAAERRALDQLAASGFRMQKGRVILGGQDMIYRFLTEGIYELQKTAEVFCSDEFRRMTPRKPHFTGTLRMQEGTLQLQMQENGEPTPEIMAILQALRDKKKYFRLKDGTFLDLTEMDEWQELAEAAVGSKAEPEEEDGRGIVEIESFRAAYMMSLLEGSVPVEADGSVQQFVSAMSEEGEACPQPLADMLRPYQMRGFMWLQALDRLGMGGVLADDMGLGKTMQIISLLLWAERRGDDRRPSIVVAPTSLVYNWMAEIRRFAPELRIAVSEGSQQARAQTIAALSKPDCAVDVYITSYPLIRRDIAQLSRIEFRFAILDEAQYIKNAMSVGAGAVKQLKAKTRFALTGTPMENHPGELWSIFDFVLPGYLLSFAQFMHRFGTGEELDVLRKRIRPFLLRRLKGDVLTELPEKNEIVMMADMTEEQRRVYQASLLRLRPQVEGMLGGRNRIEVLAAITELRQICGHPSLVLEDYAASSGKLDMLLDILPGALEAGHRALIFSQFTRMLRILQRRLEAAGVQCMYLDGETPPKRRIEMVDQFNGGMGQVFLISLKAGGSGLNLVGADTVIHFDPWWNPAAEDQATDRAHRIGQKNTVNVIRMITRGSIEEQVVRLGDRKRELFDQMITAGEAMPTQLTAEDIRALFE